MLYYLEMIITNDYMYMGFTKNKQHYKLSFKSCKVTNPESYILSMHILYIIFYNKITVQSKTLELDQFFGFKPFLLNHKSPGKIATGLG